MVEKLMSSFIANCILGNALLEEVDDYVESWHSSDNTLPLHKFLGMKKSEYNLWVSDPDVLPYIVEAHRTRQNVGDVIEDVDWRLAARFENPNKAKQLLKWLKSEGLWE